MTKQKIVVVGNGMVGHSFIEKLMRSPERETFEVVTFCEEPRMAYDRVHLSEYFADQDASRLSMVKPGFYEDNSITVHIGEMVSSIDLSAKTVTSDKGTVCAYDKLVLATGSYCFVPPVPGKDREGCFVYRTIEDLEGILAFGKSHKVGTVIGGGLLGLEAANALKQMGMETHVVELAPRLMAVQLDDAGGALLKRKIEALDVRVHTHKATQQITDGSHCLNKLVFADGEELETDMVLFSAGIRPRDELARACGLEVGPRGGIVVNNLCQTSNNDVFAIGECALWEGQIFGLVAPGYQMAQVVVDILNAKPAQFQGADMSTKLKLLGVDVGSIGDAHGTTAGAHAYVYENGPKEIYKKLVVDASGKKMLGAVLVGDAEDYSNLLQIYLNDMELPDHPDSLILPAFDGAPRKGMGVAALPDTAQICSCYDVSKADICDAVVGGAHTLPAIKASTCAGTGCGGCTALVTQVINFKLADMGMEVNTDLCEHFAYARQDLFNIIKIEGIRTFDELLAKHGKGHGCDICKPAVGSILASVWNDYVLADENIQLQDTNDTFLANMQKDGTYSVVPRMPGGEVTPDGLIAVGQVAKKFKLYTKLTGGQRVDLFGAQLNDLPAIWKELIDAGFETGHAYGKSLRTVKSCVGSTWCRYGVDDSVGLAIELENRYKGLRAPHKIKFAVSGCTRECAEAQGKDIGVIATENGWNLYVCGNGGMKPRHADLFATNLDKATLIKYIDRVLMFYVKTADRLQRTSVWMQNLEGGLDYLRDVVINDKLGLGEELEKQMQHVVDTYQCEWKTTIENPEKLKRFRTFINSDARDPNVVFVEERGQLRPANEEERQKLVVA